jgi:hypothetical protein
MEWWRDGRNPAAKLRFKIAWGEALGTGRNQRVALKARFNRFGVTGCEGSAKRRQPDGETQLQCSRLFVCMPRASPQVRLSRSYAAENESRGLFLEIVR